MPGGRPRPAGSFAAWRNRLVRSRQFQKLTARLPFLGRVAKAEGEALFDLIAGFAHSQILRALVELGVLETLFETPSSAASLAPRIGLSEDRTRLLLRGGVALGLIEPAGQGRYRTARKGAALLGVPGLSDMIAHHDILYRDLADPVAFLRGETEPELAGFWPYVFGAGGAADPEVKARYSQLMADSQILVAEDTLRMVSFAGATRVIDVGGGTGAFLSALLAEYQSLEGTLFDLPGVAEAASDRFRRAGQGERSTIEPGDFRKDPLPKGADLITLVRVLYDHQDDTVAALLDKIYSALPPGGRIVISEPMAGRRAPERAGDVYFALYCAAMGTGRVRSAGEIGALLRHAGFRKIAAPHAPRPFVTSAVTAVRPE